MVTETFLSIDVADMERATAFYVRAVGADVIYSSPIWTSLRIAGVRLGLFRTDVAGERRVGLHFVVDDLTAALASIESAGGRVVEAPREVGPGIVIADAVDSEGNVFTLR